MQRSSLDADNLETVVGDIIAQCIGRSSDEVKPGSRLFTDLGADSLDLIDIIFQLERRLGVSMEGPERSFLASLHSIPPQALLEDGAVRSEWLMTWRNDFPGLEPLLEQPSVTRAQLKDLITVEALAELLRSKQASEA